MDINTMPMNSPLKLNLYIHWGSTLWVLLCTLLTGCIRPNDAHMNWDNLLNREPRFCQKRCSGGAKLENMDADMHCATEPLLDENGNVILEPIIQGSDQDQSYKLQAMIDYFSALPGSEYSGNRKPIFIPSGVYRINNDISMMSYIYITGSKKAITVLENTTSYSKRIIFGNAANTLEVENAGINGLALKNIYVHVRKDASGADVSKTLFYDTKHAYQVRIDGGALDIEIKDNNFYRGNNHRGVAIGVGGPTSRLYRGSQSMSFACPDSPRYGTALQDTTCDFKYLAMEPPLLEMYLNAGSRQTNKEVVEIKEFSDSLKSEPGVEVACEVEWSIDDITKAILEENIDPGTKTTVEPLSVGITKLHAKLQKDHYLRDHQGSIVRNLSFTGNYFGSHHRLPLNKKWEDRLEKRFEKIEKYIPALASDDLNRFNAIWAGRTHYNTTFSENFVYGSPAYHPTTYMFISQDHCNLDINGNFFGEWGRHDRQVAIGAGKNINLFENYFYKSIVRPLQYRRLRTDPYTNAEIENFFAYYNYFEEADSGMGDFDETYVKNNWFYKSNHCFNPGNQGFNSENAYENAWQNTCTDSRATASDRTHGLDLLSAGQTPKLKDHARKVYPKVGGSVNGDIIEPSFGDEVCEPTFRPGSISRYPIVYQKTPNRRHPEETVCPTYKEAAEHEDGDGCDLYKYNHCRKHFADFTDDDTLKLGTVSSISINVQEQITSATETEVPPPPTYGCENPIGSNKQEKFVFLGSHLEFGYNTETTIMQIENLNSFRDLTKVDGQYRLMSTIFSGDLQQNRRDRRSRPLYTTIFNSIDGDKCYGYARSDLSDSGSRAWWTWNMFRHMRDSCHKKGHVSYHGRTKTGGGDKDVKGSFQYRVNLENLAVIQLHEDHDFDWEERGPYLSSSARYMDFDIYDNRGVQNDWIRRAKEDGREIVVLSVISPRYFRQDFLNYLRAHGVMAFFYTDSYRHSDFTTLQKDTTGQDFRQRVVYTREAIENNTVDLSPLPSDQRNNIITWFATVPLFEQISPQSVPLIYDSIEQALREFNDTIPFNQASQRCDNNFCAIKLGAAGEGTGVIIGVDKENGKFRIYSVIDNLMRDIAPWFELDLKNSR